ncbi:MAG: YdeI/OmpD-associated family protein [Cytophagaceae bacterium]|jgi:uncharacterized protein YdeI (YjbR/CyaY-like superfamily)|nr:YdeI/OmpD-associated family protein [Cytophagaceae bacterium]
MPSKKEIYKGVQAITARDVKAWRTWLMNHHMEASSVWLIIYHKESNVSSVYYPDAVDEALCFGWIDSKPNKRDEESYYQFFSKRNPKSNWSKINKDKVDRLTQEGRMMPAGQAMIDLAKKNGCWNALDKVEMRIVPPDLADAFTLHPKAKIHWDAFPPSVQRGILEWIQQAKKEETRRNRIQETVSKAAQNIRANQYKGG